MGFRACRVFEEAGRVAPRLVEMATDELSPGDVVVRVQWSGINYKDALAITGRGKILKRFPLNAGIDAAGIVESSEDARFRPGDAVVVNGMGLGESHDGGFAEVLRVPGDWVVPLPAGLTLRESMILGTAGFTAALAVVRMELNGQRPDKGPIVVTGATGGVGSAAVSMLAARGYRVVAVSGRPEHADYLRRLGAAEVVAAGRARARLPPARGDAVRRCRSTTSAGELLAGLVRHVGLWGQVACIGMAVEPGPRHERLPPDPARREPPRRQLRQLPDAPAPRGLDAPGRRPQAPAARRDRVAGGPARRGDRDGVSPDGAPRARPDPGRLLSIVS